MNFFTRQLDVARGYCDLGIWLEANEALEDIEPAEMRATIPVFILRERIYRASGNADGADQIAVALDKHRAYVEREGIDWLADQ